LRRRTCSHRAARSSRPGPRHPNRNYRRIYPLRRRIVRLRRRSHFRQAPRTTRYHGISRPCTRSVPRSSCTRRPRCTRRRRPAPRTTSRWTPCTPRGAQPRHSRSCRRKRACRRRRCTPDRHCSLARKCRGSATRCPRPLLASRKRAPRRAPARRRARYFLPRWSSFHTSESVSSRTTLSPQ
jgi:hypothetical protein